MATITTINGTDVISTSRGTINTNFSNLNTDKIETSVLDTDTTLAANSDSKIATQKATKAYADSVAGANASTTAKGNVEIATAAQINAGTATGETGAALAISPDQLKLSQIPITRVYGTYVGDSTTQFDITNPAGTTFRYTWDSTGTDPGISAATFVVGYKVFVFSGNMNILNTGTFTVTGSGTNYFEVTNASGVAEVNQTLGTKGYLGYYNPTWTKPAGLKYVIVEVQAGGGGGGSGRDLSDNRNGSGGGGGGYSRKLIAVASLGATETVTTGAGGAGGVTTTVGGTGGSSSFGSHATATGGTGGINAGAAGTGGIGSSGDLNVQGGGGGASIGGVGFSDPGSGMGGSSYFGGGGAGLASQGAGVAGGVYGGGGGGAYATSGDQVGGAGGAGIVIVTEYYS